MIHPEIQSFLPQTLGRFSGPPGVLSRCLGLVLPRYSYCASGIFVSKVEPAQFGNPLAWFLHIYRDLGQGQGRVAWIGSVIAQKSVPEILLGALLLVDDIARLALLCLAHLCVDTGRFVHFLYGGTILVDHGP